MPGYIEDRWWSKRPDKETGERRKLERYGQGMRYRVCGIPGVKPESFHKLADAKTWLANAQTDSRRGEYIDPRLGQMTLREYVETIWWPGRHDPVGTAKPMKSRIWNHILPYLGHLPLAAIQKEQLRAWLKALRASGDLGESTIEVTWIHLSSIFRAAVGTRLLKNPCADLGEERPTGGGETKARAWTSAEARAIRTNLPERYRAAVDLGLHAGLRQGEAFGFSPDDIDEDRMVVHLRRQLLWDPSKPYMKLPKGRKERDVPLSPGLLKLLREHEDKFPPVEVELPWQGPGNDNRATVKVRLLLTTTFGNRINNSGFNKTTLKPALAAAGIIAPRDEASEGSGWEGSREKMFHRFRHTYASVQLHKGEDVVSVSKWLGHASPDITYRIYAHFMPDNGLRGRVAIDNWLDEDAPAAADLRVVETALSIPDEAFARGLAVMFARGVRRGDGWEVAFQESPDAEAVARVWLGPGSPDAAVLAAEAWLRDATSSAGLSVLAVENRNAQYAGEDAERSALARFVVTRPESDGAWGSGPDSQKIST